MGLRFRTLPEEIAELAPSSTPFRPRGRTTPRRSWSSRGPTPRGWAARIPSIAFAASRLQKPAPARSCVSTSTYVGHERHTRAGENSLRQAFRASIQKRSTRLRLTRSQNYRYRDRSTPGFPLRCSRLGRVQRIRRLPGYARLPAEDTSCVVPVRPG
jgi:hypothetical protein